MEKSERKKQTIFSLRFDENISPEDWLEITAELIDEMRLAKSLEVFENDGEVSK